MKGIKSFTTYDTDQPWIVYHYLTHDAWWPFWNSTRFLGRSRIECECAVCGVSEILTFRIPRFGPVPDKGKHPERVRFLLTHIHPDRPHPMAWKKPLINPAAHNGGINLDLLSMRLEAELGERGEDA